MPIVMTVYLTTSDGRTWLKKLPLPCVPFVDMQLRVGVIFEGQEFLTYWVIREVVLKIPDGELTTVAEFTRADLDYETAMSTLAANGWYPRH